MLLSNWWWLKVLWKEACWEYCMSTFEERSFISRAEWSRLLLSIKSRSSPGPDMPLGSQQQVDPCNCRVVSKKPEMTSQKSSLTMGKWNCQAIQANIKKNKGKIKNGLKVHCSQQCGKHQITWKKVYNKNTRIIYLYLFFSVFKKVIIFPFRD